jgi:tRNA-specific 2-thiouridylase
VLQARQVADQLGFPHYTLDLRPAFQELVIQNFVQEYLQGRTPNPCVVCNRHIKFGWLLAQARALGADFLATGHYARIQRDEKSQRFVILKGVDPRKDQSYFLYKLTQEQLSQVLFPLGLFQKDKIRKIARDLGLNNADQPESQEICFIENNDYRDFLRKCAASLIKPGPFLDQQGEVLGQHQGLPFYTVGQRKGLGLALGHPMYVVRIDLEHNAVVLGNNDKLFSQRVWAENNNFFPFAQLEKPVGVFAKIRSTAKPAAATIFPAPGQQVVVEFAEPQRAVTPGQAIVYYQGELVVGGGTIVRAE